MELLVMIGPIIKATIIMAMILIILNWML